MEHQFSCVTVAQGSQRYYHIYESEGHKLRNQSYFKKMDDDALEGVLILPPY